MLRAATLGRVGARRGGGVAPLPAHVEPMLATLADGLPDHPERYAYEWKWDGVRALLFVQNKRLRLDSRNLLDVTHQYPELHDLAVSLRGRNAVLDGEIVALDDGGMPSFPRLQRRMHIASAATARRLAEEVPAQLMLFDLLHLDGRSLVDQPYQARREKLEALVPEGPSWRVPPSHAGGGAAMLAAARRSLMEGIVAKTLDGTYEPGRRSRAWLKVKVVQGQEFVVGGYVPERSGRAGRIGALLIGYHDAAGRLQYAGRIGSGLTGPDHAMLLARLARHAGASNPFAVDPASLRPGRWGQPVSDSTVVYVDPAVVVQVEFRRWPAGGLVQQGAFKGVRLDKKPRQVVKESAAAVN